MFFFFVLKAVADLAEDNRTCRACQTPHPADFKIAMSSKRGSYAQVRIPSSTGPLTVAQLLSSRHFVACLRGVAEAASDAAWQACDGPIAVL